RVCDDFLAGVERNIRTRIAAEWLTNLRMIFLPDYSRTMRAGDLYEREIFSRVKDNGGDRPRWLNGLLIQPPDAPAPFPAQGPQLASGGQDPDPGSQRHDAQHRPQLAIHGDVDGRTPGRYRFGGRRELPLAPDVLQRSADTLQANASWTRRRRLRMRPR